MNLLFANGKNESAGFLLSIDSIPPLTMGGFPGSKLGEVNQKPLPIIISSFRMSMKVSVSFY